MEIVYFDKDVNQVIQDLVGLILQYVAGIALLVLVCAGVYHMYAGGDPGKEKRAKQAITYTVLGLLVILLSYAMIRAVQDVAVN